MKKFVVNSILFASLALPVVSYAGQLCSAGIIKGIADGPNGAESTIIYTDQAEGPKNLVTLNYTGLSSAKFDSLSKNLRSAFFSRTAVRIYSNNARGCDNIDEVRVCTDRSDCM